MKITVMVPTYNEKSNLAELVELIHRDLPEASVLIVDDSSPDGTSEEARRLMEGDPRLGLLRRGVEVKGRGWAGRDGFLRALEEGAEIVVEMDGDLSHQPKFLPALVAPIRSGEADVVIGSRYIPGGKDMDRPLHRRWVSAFARAYLGLLLGTRVKDPTSGYRVFSRPALLAIDPASLKARDPFIVSELLHRCSRAGLRMVEAPIEFLDRTKGESKLGMGTLLSYLARVLGLRFFPWNPSGRK